ncbi:MAG: phosphotransferase [Clostridia bacterium]|nr:phosphotransferase [Clostridia bacterium]
MKFQKENNEYTIFLEGRIDSNNSPEVEKEILDIGFSSEDDLVLDAENLEYISSAGLRVILRLKKSNKSTKIINACSDVYEIFDMTGFTEMMDISKAYRKMDVSGCEVIGEGANGLVYRIDADTIIKVYKNPDSLDEIHNERELARKAFVMGIPTAIPYDVVRVGDLYGSVFELLDAQSFGKLLVADNSLEKQLAKESTEILKAMHATQLSPGELPDKKAEAVIWANFTKEYLSPEAGDKLLAMMQDIPETHNMLHGDYHIKNIMKQNGENLLIDMDTLSMGHPIFEFAAMFLAYLGFSCVDHENVLHFLGISYEVAHDFWRDTLHFYFPDKDDSYLDQIELQAGIIGYTRMLRRIIRKVGLDTDLKKQEFEYCKQYIEENVHKVTSLYF